MLNRRRTLPCCERDVVALGIAEERDPLFLARCAELSSFVPVDDVRRLYEGDILRDELSVLRMDVSDDAPASNCGVATAS